MTLPTASPTDYLWAFQRLLPRGRVWQRGWGTLQAEALLLLMPTWARLHGRLNDLHADIFPCSTIELLPEWEATLGLPDPCTGTLSTIQQRQAAVCGKFVARGGQSQEYFIHLAASLGYQITIETFKPFYASQGKAGDPCYDEQWVYAWRVVVQSSAVVVWFRASQSAAGEPLAAYAADLLRCMIDRLKPANTEIIWGYRIDSSVWDEGYTIYDHGDSIWDRGATGDAIAN